MEMNTEKPFLTHIFKTLKPNSDSISPKSNANPTENSLIQPSNNSNQFRKRMGDQNLDQVSELFMLQVNDCTKSPKLCKTLDQNSSPIPPNCNLINSTKLRVEEGSDRSNTQKKIALENDVIEVKDDDFDDCVFVKKEKNLLPRGMNKNDPICVDGYVKDVKFENKVSIGVAKVVHCVDYYDVGDNDEVKIVGAIPSFKKKKKNRSFFDGVSVVEIGESSGSKNRRNDDNDDHVVIMIDDSVEEEVMFLCEICADSKPRKELFTIKGCSHSYCSDCMKNYVASKLQDGVSIVNCPVPGCCGVLEPEYCRDILPFEVFVRWGNLLCESVILASQKFYCPFKDCSALLIDDGGENVTQAECPSCFRLFCAQCKVGWHNGIECAEYQKLGKDERQKEDLMLRNLAKNKNWQRCPACKFYVEKSEGCLYMKCRCGIAFCYRCGAINTDHRFHNCKKCGR